MKNLLKVLVLITLVGLCHWSNNKIIVSSKDYEVKEKDYWSPQITDFKITEYDLFFSYFRNSHPEGRVCYGLEKGNTGDFYCSNFNLISTKKGLSLTTGEGNQGDPSDPYVFESTHSASDAAFTIFGEAIALIAFGILLFYRVRNKSEEPEATSQSTATTLVVA